MYPWTLGLKRELLCEEQGGGDDRGVQAKRRRALWAAQSQVDKMDAPHVLFMLFWQVGSELVFLVYSQGKHIIDLQIKDCLASWVQNMDSEVDLLQQYLGLFHWLVCEQWPKLCLFVGELKLCTLIVSSSRIVKPICGQKSQ